MREGGCNGTAVHFAVYEGLMQVLFGLKEFGYSDSETPLRSQITAPKM